MAHLDDYSSRAIRALVLLHERELRAFTGRWQEANRAGIRLLNTTDPNYESLDTLLLHVLRASRGYLTWVCQKLELPDPRLPEVPPASEVAERSEEYLSGLLGGWREALRQVPSERLADRSYAPRRGPEQTILAMLEHAVMHPIRHSFQLDELMASPADGPRTEGS